MTTTTTRVLRDGWDFRETNAPAIPHSDTTAWLPAVVPGHVHDDLLRAGVIPDPFARMNERTVQWVDDRDWEYRCIFAVSDAELDGTRHVLRFDGLDTIATVLLNSKQVGAVDNMFVEHEFDVTEALRPGDNVLQVQFASAERVGAERRRAALPAFDDHPQKHGLAAGLMSRTFVRKAQYMWGWDWGPQLRGCGIWKDVTLLRIPVARLGDWSWRSSFNPDGSCDVTVVAAADGAADAVRVSLAGQTASAAPGAEATITIADPQRWWPNGMGAQHLYDLQIELLAGAVVVDSRAARVGLREIELVREADDAGESFFFRVNGVATYAKGANWIPDDSMPARTTRERVRAQLELARDAHMNMLRIWGGGMYESADFYDVCDELGLLVWQDFPFACALYPEDDAFTEVIVAEARTAIRRLRNYTSLALWCGNNENQWLAWMGMFGRGTPVLGNRHYHDALPAVVAAEDPTRDYWPSSPFGNEENPSDDASGDSHYWNVWHGEGDWVHYQKCTSRFVSEFGFAAAPDLSTLEGCLDPADLAVDTPAMRWHDKTGKGYETYLGYVALHYPMPTTVPDLVYFSQLNQADGMRFGIEHFRRLRPHNMGTLVWQLNDCWPVQSWAWVDYHLRPKAAWYAARQFYAPLLLSLWREGNVVHAHLVNDDGAARSGTVALRVASHDGAELWSAKADATVDGLGSVEALAVELPADVLDAAATAVVHATFADVEASLLLVEPKDMRLPVAQLRVTPLGDGRLRVESSTLAVSVKLWLEGADATWSDNYFHLLPGEAREVTVRTEVPANEVAARLRWRSL